MYKSAPECNTRKNPSKLWKRTKKKRWKDLISLFRWRNNQIKKNYLSEELCFIIITRKEKKLGFSENFQNTTIDEIFYKQTKQLTVNGYRKFTTENSRMRYPPWIVTLIYNHFHKTVTDEEVMYVSIVFQFVA